MAGKLKYEKYKPKKIEFRCRKNLTNNIILMILTSESQREP